MAAQLTPVEMLAKEIEHMEGRKASLQAAIKALEAKGKDIRSQLDLSEVAAKAELAKQEARVEQERAKLETVLVPLLSKVATLTNEVASAEKRLAVFQHQHSIWVGEKQADVARLTKAIAEKEQRLAGVLAEITDVKAKVATL